MIIKLTLVRIAASQVSHWQIYPSDITGIIPRLLHALREAGIVTEDLALPDDLHAPEAVYRGLCKLPDTVDHEGNPVPRLRRRIDILSIPWQNRGAALLYYTVRRSSVGGLWALICSMVCPPQGDDIVCVLQNLPVPLFLIWHYAVQPCNALQSQQNGLFVKSAWFIPGCRPRPT